MKALFPCHNDCTPRFSRARSWQSHFLCNFMVVFLNEDIGCSEARGQSLPAPFSGLFRSMFPFTWWKVIHHLHPWILPLFSFFSPPVLAVPPSLFSVTTFFTSLLLSESPALPMAVLRDGSVQYDSSSANPENRLALPGLHTAPQSVMEFVTSLPLEVKSCHAQASFSIPEVALAPSGACELKINFFSPPPVFFLLLQICQVPLREVVDSQWTPWANHKAAVV